MSGASIVIHGGKQIIFVDFRNCDERQDLQVIAEGAKLIRKQPNNSALVLCDFTDSPPIPQILQPLREFVTGNSPFVKASAILGITGMGRVLYNSVMKLAGRNIPIIEDYEQAKEWLIAQ